MRSYSFALVLLVVLLGCSKKSNSAGEIINDSPQEAKPNNIYWCASGSTIGIDIRCCQEAQVREYFLNGKKLTSTINANLARDDENGYQYFFERDGAHLTVYVTNSLGEGVDVLNCIHHVE